MLLRTRKNLLDIDSAASFLTTSIAGKTEQDYLEDRGLRSIVERQFEIIGEALNRVQREDPQTFNRISDARQIVAFRNLLIHGYDIVDDVRVWSVAIVGLPVLAREVRELLGDEL